MPPKPAVAVDMQTVAVLAQAAKLGAKAAAVLFVVADSIEDEPIEDESRDQLAKRAGKAAAAALETG